MNSKPSLDSAYAQVNRAAELLVGLKRLHDSVIDAYKKATTAEVKPNVVMDPGDRPRVGTAIMFDSGDYQFKVPDKVRILTGEISNSLRSALDYLIARLVELDEGVVTSNNQFPIEQRPKQFYSDCFSIANDPVGAGLVSSLARPGGNVTGLSQLAADLGGKRLEILREIAPAVKRVAVLGDAGNQAAAPEMRQVQDAARSLGLESTLLDVRRAEEIGPAIEDLKGNADALYVQSGPLMNTNRVRISTLALGIRLPTLSGIRDYVDAGALLSYGPNFPDMFRRAAELADKILHGAKPADLPIEQPTKFELVLNLTTAKVLGLKIPEAFLLRVDAIVE